MTSRWRARSRAVIAAAIAAYEGDVADVSALRKHISAAYPFGPREHHPYKIWLSEVAATLKRLRSEPARPQVQPTSGPLFGGES